MERLHARNNERPRTERRMLQALADMHQERRHQRLGPAGFREPQTIESNRLTRRKED